MSTNILHLVVCINNNHPKAYVPLEYVEDSVKYYINVMLSITKGINLATVAENGQLTYTFVIQHFGSQPAVATDNAVVTDTFNPILNPITVTYEGEIRTEGTN